VRAAPSAARLGGAPGRQLSLSCPGWEPCTGRTSPCPCLQLCSASAAAEAAAAHRADAARLRPARAGAWRRGGGGGAARLAAAARRGAAPRRARRCRRRRRRLQCSRAWRRSRRPRRSPNARPLREARAGGARRRTSRRRRQPSAPASSSKSTWCRRPSNPRLAGACTRGPTARPLALLRAPAAGSPAAGRLHAGRGGPVGRSDSGRRIGGPRLWDGRARLMGGLAAGGAQEEMAASGADAAGAAYRERVAQASEAFTARDFATASALKAEARAGRAWAGRFGLNMRGHAEVGLLGFVGACGARGSPRRRGRFPRSRAPRRALRRPAALALMSWRARHAGARLPRPGVAAGQGGAAPNQAAHVRRPPACAPRRAAGRCTRVCSVCLARLCTGSHHHQKAMRRRRRLMQRRFVCGAAA